MSENMQKRVISNHGDNQRTVMRDTVQQKRVHTTMNGSTVNGIGKLYTANADKTKVASLNIEEGISMSPRDGTIADRAEESKRKAGQMKERTNTRDNHDMGQAITDETGKEWLGTGSTHDKQKRTGPEQPREGR